MNKKEIAAWKKKYNRALKANNVIELVATVNKVDSLKFNKCLTVIDQAVKFMVESGRGPRILIKIAKNLGDTIHSMPIIKHFRTLHPDSCIILLCEEKYASVHEYNQDLDKVYGLPNNLDEITRGALWDPIKTRKEIDIAIIPTINPFQYWHDSNKWLSPHPNIVDQVLHNAGIREPAGGKLIQIEVDDADKKWAEKFNGNLIAIEYISYSHDVPWWMGRYEQLVKLANQKGYQCLSLAASHEPLIAGTLDARGTTWRQTVALLGKVKYLLGCCSGNTVLALGARPQPTIIELDAPQDCRADGTGYVVPGNKCYQLYKATPEQVAALL